MVLDRGFRDIVSELKKDYNLDFKNANLCTKGAKGGQLTTKEANMSRFVTKIRYVIEVINDVFKLFFKTLDTLNNQRIKTLMMDFRISAVLINIFHRRRFSDGVDAIEMAKLMKIKKTLNNSLDLEFKSFLLSKNLIKLDASDDFPKITY